MILDLGLPGMSGMDVIRALRRWSRVPIIVPSACWRRAGEVDALDLGANDYVQTKPFGIGELLARLRAVCTEPPTAAQTVIANDDFTLDLAQRRDRRFDQAHLPPIEWRLVETLTRQADSLVHGTTLLQTDGGLQYGRENEPPAGAPRGRPQQASARPSTPEVLHHRTRRRVPLRQLGRPLTSLLVG